MKALVLTGPGEFSVEEVPRPSPGPEQVLCRVRALSICGTDAHLIRGDYPGFWPPAYPFIPGHEWAGEVVELGAGCADAGVGGRGPGGRHLSRRLRPLPALYRGPLQPVRELREARAASPVRAHHPGGMCRVRGARGEGGVPPARRTSATTTGRCSTRRRSPCTRPTGPGAARATRWRSWARGRMGLLAADAARARGAGRVIVVGRGDRLAKAAALGHEVVDYRDVDPVGTVRAATGGIGPDAVLDCAGVPDSLRWGIAMVRKGGRCVVVGIPVTDVALSLQRPGAVREGTARLPGYRRGDGRRDPAGGRRPNPGAGVAHPHLPPGRIRRGAAHFQRTDRRRPQGDRRASSAPGT